MKYLFSIKNKQNGILLGPIGSQCIKKFERTDLNEQTANFEKLFKIQSALSKNKFIGLSSELFNKKLIEFFYEQDVYDINDFDFLMDMFNKKYKSKITAKQQKRIIYHIIGQVIPY